MPDCEDTNSLFCSKAINPDCTLPKTQELCPKYCNLCNKNGKLLIKLYFFISIPDIIHHRIFTNTYILICLPAVETLTCGASPAPQPALTQVRITNGTLSHIKNWPWIAALFKSTHIKPKGTRLKEPYCGGTLISKRYILTAGHCAIG